MSRINFIFFLVSFQINADINGRKGQNRKHQLTADAGLHKVVSGKVCVIAVQRRKLGENGHDRKAQIGNCENDAHHAAGEEIAVVHMRKQERYADSQKHRHAENDTVVKLFAVCYRHGEHDEHKHECGDDEQHRPHLGVLTPPEHRGQGGSIVIHSIAHRARLREIKSQRVPKRPACDNGGQHHDEVRSGENEKMLELYLLCNEQHKEYRHHEHRLELERKRCRDSDHCAHRLVAQRKVQRQHGKEGIDTVALRPVCAVEHDGGEQRNGKKADDEPQAAFCKQRAQLHARPRKQHIENDRQKLYQVQLTYINIGKKRKEIQIRQVVVADRQPQRLEPSVLTEKLRPRCKEGLIVAAFKIEQKISDNDRTGHKKKGKNEVSGAFQKPLTPKQEHPQRKYEQHRYHYKSVHKQSNLTKKRRKLIATAEKSTFHKIFLDIAIYTMIE